mmetsp:Transcript_70668/g.143526  ORF Transcript_70668/g.143526 Transcript_70668/m.143526 type:complete len:266 (-) Transcript_70668:2-799(-)
MVEGLLLPLVCIIAELDCCVHDVLEVLGTATHGRLHANHVVVPIAVVVVAREPGIALRAPLATHKRVSGVGDLITPMVLGQRGLLRQDLLELRLAQFPQDFGKLLRVTGPQRLLHLLQVPGLGCLLVLQSADKCLEVLVEDGLLQGLQEPWLVLGDARQQGCGIHACVRCVLRARLRRWQTSAVQFRREGLHFATLGSINVDRRILPFLILRVLSAVDRPGFPARLDHDLASIFPSKRRECGHGDLRWRGNNWAATISSGANLSA